jgi:hypothetical protein
MLGLVLFDDTVIGDLDLKGKAIYKKVKEVTGLKFSKYGYCESDATSDQIAVLRALGYELKYFDGCFNPYLCKIKKGRR